LIIPNCPSASRGLISGSPVSNNTTPSKNWLH